jgi:serine protease AprX
MAAGFFLLAVLHPLSTASPIQADSSTLDVLVQGEGAAAALAAVGGRPLATLPIVDGLLGRVPAGQVERLRRDRRRVRAVLDANRPLHLQGVAALPDAAAATVGFPAVAAAVPERRSSTHGARGRRILPPQVIEARHRYVTAVLGDAGRGVAVAVLDTGIAAAGDLAGRVVARADLSGEGSFTDAYGHGTFMAGLIAGDGRGGGPVGAAPGADLVDLKVAGADGSTTLAQVLLAMQLADSARERFDIRVLNISLGAPADDPATAPLTEAVERLWADGVTVVAAAGNGGGGVTAPGLDPYVVTVGALDPAAGQAPAWSGRGPDFAGRAKPDLLAPGVDVVGLRAPGSTVDLANPAARVGDAYFRGSGTSMSTARVAGAAAAIAAAHPDWGPDQVKAALARSTHTPGGALDPDAALGLAAVAPANGDLFPLRTPGAAAEPDAPDWLGALDWRTGAFEGLRWTLADGAEPAAGPAAWEAGPWLATRWTTGQAGSWAAQQWLSRSWAARSWVASGLDPAGWAALQWGWGAVASVLAGGTQALLGWTSRRLAGLDTRARSWVARHWAELVLAARSWAARSWAGADWIARSWAARSWGARSWGLAVS